MCEAAKIEDPKNCIEKDLRWKLAERLVATSGFVKSTRLSSLLLHIVQQTIHGKDRDLHEQLIGERVFGRPVGYDPRDDNIVRAHASRLRQKLEAYYREEGRDEPLRVLLPRGSYVPSFERADASPSVQPTVPSSEKCRLLKRCIFRQRQRRHPPVGPGLSGPLQRLHTFCFLFIPRGKGGMQW